MFDKSNHLVIFILVVLLKKLNLFQVRKTLCFRDIALFNTSNKTIKKQNFKKQETNKQCYCSIYIYF